MTMIFIDEKEEEEKLIAQFDVLNVMLRNEKKLIRERKESVHDLMLMNT